MYTAYGLIFASTPHRALYTPPHAPIAPLRAPEPADRTLLK